MSSRTRGRIQWLALAAAACAVPAMGQDEGPPSPESGKKPDFPPFKDVSEGYEKVVSTVEGQPFYTLWTREKDGQLLAELPRGYEGMEQFFAMTVSSGEIFAGLQGGDMLVTWKRYDKRLALVAPNLDIRSTGDQESKDSVKQIFTDRVVLDIPIVCMGPGGQPVIDLDELLIGQGSRFFGGSLAGANKALTKIIKSKAFPENVEVALQVPVNGRFKTVHYSISKLRGTPAFKPRKADERVGYFVTTYRDLGKFDSDEVAVRFCNRWHLEKRDPKLKLSPPKEPIVFYIEHTVPVRYRRFVQQGIEYWNKAFRQVGILGAIEVRQQDKETGAFMTVDPEDVRYNFIRWLSNDVGTAIGPSRVNPRTGEILDADVVLTDGWIRHFEYEYSHILPQMAMEGFSPETLAWLESRPRWDPRIRMADPADREYILSQRAERGVLRYGGHPAGAVNPDLIGDDEYDGLIGRTSQINGFCSAATGRAFDMAVMRLNLAMMPPAEGEEAPKGDIIDGIPEQYVGPLLADLVAHEVGHTLGLRHNFRASAVYSHAQMNSDEFKGKKPITASVMDYNPTNFNMDESRPQGDYAMIDIGPYDLWAIEYGYTTDESELPRILKRCTEPELQYATDEDTGGPDPLARRYDFTANPLEWAQSQLKLSRFHRERLLEKFVKDGESWSRVRRGYQITLGMQTQAVGMMANWVGGAHVYKNKKGDPDARAPIEVVPAQKQRDALKFVIDNTFNDAAFGLTPELLRYMTVDKWWDDNSAMQEPTWPVHDRVMGIQASALTMLLNPTTLRRVYDNEFRVPAEEDALTLPELMQAVSDAAWGELSAAANGTFTARKPMVSSLRRNLQREHLERLFDLAGPDSGFTAAYKPITNLAVAHLRELRERIARSLDETGTRIDPYTKAHLSEAKLRIEKVLDAQYIYNANAGGLDPFLFPFAAPQPQPAVAFAPEPAPPRDEP